MTRIVLADAMVPHALPPVKHDIRGLLSVGAGIAVYQRAVSKVADLSRCHVWLYLPVWLCGTGLMILTTGSLYSRNTRLALPLGSEKMQTWLYFDRSVQKHRIMVVI